MAVEDEQQSKRIKASHSSIPTLLPDIIFEILTRLPVESLLRCKSVCKSWCSLISCPNFINSHLKSSITSSHDMHRRLIFCSFPEKNLKSCPLYDVLFDKTIRCQEPDYPLKTHQEEAVSIFGCCNGLLLIVIDETTTFIWNPSTRRSNMLPSSGTEPCIRYLSFGFGYDEVADDYKVIGNYECLTNKNKSFKRVSMYSLKTGNWKKIGDLPYGNSLISGAGKFSNGALHWYASAKNSSSSSPRLAILSLDLAKETYGEILQPRYDEGEKDFTLGVLGEWLSVVCNYHAHRADVWVMKVYGVKDSWTKLASIPYQNAPVCDRFFFPVCTSNDGKILFQISSKLALYDGKNNSFTEIRNVDLLAEIEAELWTELEAYTYVESLVSPESPAGPQDD